MNNLYLSTDYIIVNDNDTNFYIVKKFPFQKFAINQDSYKILELIEANQGLPKEEEPLAEHIKDFIQQLLNLGILTQDCNKKSSTNIKKITMQPSCKRIFLEMTPHCNLKCQHCYNSYDQDMTEKPLTLIEVKELIDQAHTLGVWQFELTGGELFLRDDLLEILDYLNQKGMLVTLFSNLTLLDEEKIKKLKEFNIHKINTSLDGFSDEVHDRFRGVEGSRKKTIANIKLLKKYGIDVNVNVIIGDHNFAEIDQLIDYLRFDLQVSYMADLILPLGRGSNVTNFEKYAKYLGYLNSLKSKDSKCSVQNMGEFEAPKQLFCGIGENFLYISYEGSVNLCTSLTYRVSDEFYFGNVKKDQLEDIWTNRMTKFRNLACENFENCKAKDKCKGGCRSRAYSVYGSMQSADKVYCKIYGCE